mmetsp:Transcript_21853/g.64497  ORF Transcript_21853/g.64497 Transcript_21853/m.64497 type:complete len:244 (+) Transcript_21853:618-1349(+)
MDPRRTDDHRGRLSRRRKMDRRRRRREAEECPPPRPSTIRASSRPRRLGNRGRRATARPPRTAVKPNLNRLWRRPPATPTRRRQRTAPPRFRHPLISLLTRIRRLRHPARRWRRRKTEMLRPRSGRGEDCSSSDPDGGRRRSPAAAAKAALDAAGASAALSSGGQEDVWVLSPPLSTSQYSLIDLRGVRIILPSFLPDHRIDPPIIIGVIWIFSQYSPANGKPPVSVQLCFILSTNSCAAFTC